MVNCIKRGSHITNLMPYIIHLVEVSYKMFVFTGIRDSLKNPAACSDCHRSTIYVHQRIYLATWQMYIMMIHFLIIQKMLGSASVLRLCCNMVDNLSLNERHCSFQSCDITVCQHNKLIWQTYGDFFRIYRSCIVKIQFAQYFNISWPAWAHYWKSLQIQTPNIDTANFDKNLLG